MKDVMDSTPLRHVVSALGAGIVVVDDRGDVVWMDGETRSSIDGELKRLDLPLQRGEGAAVDCFLSPVEVTIGGRRKNICVIQQASPDHESRHELIAGIEAVMADSSWFSRTITDRVKAWMQVRRPARDADELDGLTHREREILAMICEGRSSAEMGELLGLSQNTVRNHVTSLYRKIGVNRRSGAMVWARERALTAEDIMAASGRRAKRDRRAPRA